jgi:predicted outer membrane repeat protein
MRSVPSARLDILRRWLCALLCVAALTAPESGAAQTEVDRCGSDVEPGGTNLGIALAAGGQITFRCGGAATIRITKQHSVTRSVDIDGGGQVTLDGNNQAAFLLVTGPTGPQVTVRLANLTIRRMAHPAGTMAGVFQGLRIVIVNSAISESNSPIVANTQVAVENSTFDANRGVLINANNVDLTRTTIRSNGGPPLMTFGGRINIIDSTFDGNRGSIFLKGGNCSVNIVRTTFTNNRSTSLDFETPGGGAFVTQCATEIENSKFLNNNTSANGGAIRMARDAPRVSIRGSRFEGNTATGGGGAIAMDSLLAPRRVLALQYTILTGNKAKIGAAISLGEAIENDTRLEGNGVTFTGNAASDRGGAIAGTNASVIMLRGVFRRNEAQSGAAIWLNTLGDRASVIANTLFALNKAPGGTFVGNLTRFANTTMVGSEGPGLVQFPAFTGTNPARAIRLANSIVENNSGGNCRPGASGVVDEGSNLQFPGTTCGAGIPVAAAVLDTFYAPIIGGAARARGNDKVCAADPVHGHDLYGEKRPQTDRCSIGAVEGDLERLMRRRLASKSATPETPQCPPGTTGRYPNCSPKSSETHPPKPEQCPGGYGRWPNCRPTDYKPPKPYGKRKAASRCGPRMIGIPPYCYPRHGYRIPNERLARKWLQRYQAGPRYGGRRRY